MHRLTRRSLAPLAPSLLAALSLTLTPACGSGGDDGTGRSAPSGPPKPVSKQIDPLPTDASADCLVAGSTCQSTSDPCCDGSTCIVLEGRTNGVCASRCAADADCASGCCTWVYDGSPLVCAERAFCVLVGGGNACIEPGFSCASNYHACCDGSICVDDGSNVRCAVPCVDHAQCNSGCCARLRQSSVYVCSPASICR